MYFLIDWIMRHLLTSCSGSGARSVLGDSLDEEVVECVLHGESVSQDGAGLLRQYQGLRRLQSGL